MKRHFSLSFALPLLALLASFEAYAATRPFKVVIDPGHGGNDYGTIYQSGGIRIAEKAVTLLLARQVASQLKSQGIDVTLTRGDDRDIALGKRTEIANRLGADVFISIHMNSSHEAVAKNTAEGVETYILDNATDASSKRLAHLENTVISHDGNETPAQQDVALILRDLRLDANLAESKRLACAIQNNLLITSNRLVAGTSASSSQRDTRRRNRGVKQALFHVLLGADMPSALLEAGFLSSPRDRALVLSSKGRKAMAESITRAIEQYRSLKGTAAATVALSNCQVR